MIVWHVLSQQKPYADLGADYFTRRTDAEAHARRLARQIEKLGYAVTMAPAAA